MHATVYYVNFIYSYAYVDLYNKFMHMYYTNEQSVRQWSRGSIPGEVILKNQKVVLDAALLNPRYYKVMIKGKVEQSGKWSCALPYTTVY